MRCSEDPSCLERLAKVLEEGGVPPAEARELAWRALLAYVAGGREAARAALELGLAELRARGLLR